LHLPVTFATSVLGHLSPSSVFQCARYGVNSERCGRGPSLFFRPTVGSFSVHVLAWIRRDVGV